MEEKRSKVLLDDPKGPGVPRVSLKAKSNSIKPMKTFIISRSTVLSQVKDFLPHLANANTRLKDTNELDGKSIVVEDVENVSDDEKEHVEMNLALVPIECSSSDDSEDECEKPNHKLKLKPPSIKDHRYTSSMIQDMTVHCTDNS